MEVITIENKAYQELMRKLDQMHDFFRSFSQPKEVKEVKEDKEVWLDTKTVCERLKISTRTLFRLRKERLISYSVFRGRCRFKESEVEQIMRERVIVANPETLDEMRQTL